jgi:hypothetical protein
MADMKKNPQQEEHSTNKFEWKYSPQMKKSAGRETCRRIAGELLQLQEAIHLACKWQRMRRSSQAHCSGMKTQTEALQKYRIGLQSKVQGLRCPTVLAQGQV